MEADLGTPGADTAQVAAPVDAQPAAQSTAGEPGQQDADRASVNAGMNAFMRGTLDAPAATSKPAETAASGEPAPQGDVEAGSEPPPRGPDGKFLPRRGVPEVAKLREQHFAEFQAEQARSAESAKLTQLEQTRAADVARYRRLQDTPDTKLSGDDYAWREDFKERLELLPEVGAMHQTIAEQRIVEARTAFHADQRAQITSAASEFGADAEAWKTPGTSWLSMTRDCVEAATAPLQERIASLERDLHASRTNGLGTARTPVAAGRSSPGTPSRDMNSWLRGN